MLIEFNALADPVRRLAANDDDPAHHVHVALIDMLIEVGLVPEEHRQH